MSIAGFLEKVVAGDKNFSRDLVRLTDFGRAEYGRGVGVSGEGLDGIRASIGTYDGMLSSGNVLPASVARAFDLARGGVKDESARSMAGIRATIANRRAATGGLMSAEAASEFERMGERDVRSKAFDTTRDIDIAQANQIMTATQDLFGRLDAARGRILAHGEYQQGVGADLYKEGLLGRYRRNMGIASTMTGAGQSAMGVWGGGN